MKQRDLEWFAFLFLCGKRDRDILLGREKMTFEDLERLMYVTDFLGMEYMNVEIWNQHAEQFKENLEGLAEMYEKDEDAVCEYLGIVDENRQEEWLREFVRQIPDEENRELIEEIIDHPQHPRLQQFLNFVNSK